MDDFITQHFSENEPPQLTTEERVAGRFALQARMAFSLTDDEKAVGRRMLQNLAYADPAPASIWSVLLSPVRLPLMAAAVLVLCASGGGFVAFAAERALPGDALYGVKIHVNEAIRERLQLTDEARSAWELERLHRRIDEMRKLEARGDAEEQVDVAIGEHIERAAAVVEARIDALPAAASERAAMRTAVNAALGTDQDSVRRASRINKVLKALKERADGFEPRDDETMSAAAANAAAKATLDEREGPLRVEIETSGRGEVETERADDPREEGDLRPDGHGDDDSSERESRDEDGRDGDDDRDGEGRGDRDPSLDDVLETVDDAL